MASWAAALLVTAACSSSAEPAQTMPSVSESYQTATVEELAAALQTDPRTQLVDVREPPEWSATGVIAEAKLIPLGDLRALAPGELAEDRPVYVICRSGNRSRTGAQTLVDLSFREVYTVQGGITAWIKAGLPVTPYLK